MTERELDDMMAALAGLFRWDVLLGERFGLRAALRAERGRVMSLGGRFHTGSTLDAASQEGTEYGQFSSPVCLPASLNL
jgi:hypothetical protein